MAKNNPSSNDIPEVDKKYCKICKKGPYERLLSHFSRGEGKKCREKYGDEYEILKANQEKRNKDLEKISKHKRKDEIKTQMVDYRLRNRATNHQQA